MNIRPYLAELLGTFTLALFVCVAVAGAPTYPISYIAPIVLATFVYTIGSISGAHLNPAVTIGLASIKKISVVDAVYYVLAQMLGAILAMVVCRLMLETVPTLSGDISIRVAVAEAMGTFLLVWSIMAVVEKKVHAAASGLTIGFGLLLGILLAASLGSFGIINPAVAFSVNAFTVANLVGPIVGAVAAAWCYRALVETPKVAITA